MPACLELDHAAVVDRGADVALALRQVRERAPQVELGEQGRGGLDPRAARGDAGAQAVEQLRFSGPDALLGPQDLRLVLLQLRVTNRSAPDTVWRRSYSGGTRGRCGRVTSM